MWLYKTTLPHTLFIKKVFNLLKGLFIYHYFLFHNRIRLLAYHYFLFHIKHYFSLFNYHYFLFNNHTSYSTNYTDYLFVLTFSSTLQHDYSSYIIQVTLFKLRLSHKSVNC